MDAKQAPKNANKTKNISIAPRIKNAIMKLQGNKGVTLVNLKKYLRDEKKLDVDALNEEIKLALRDGMKRDVLTRESGLYKVKVDKHRGAKLLQGKRKRQDAISMCKTPVKESDKKAPSKK